MKLLNRVPGAAAAGSGAQLLLQMDDCLSRPLALLDTVVVAVEVVVAVNVAAADVSSWQWECSWQLRDAGGCCCRCCSLGHPPIAHVVAAAAVADGAAQLVSFLALGPGRSGASSCCSCSPRG